MRLNCLIIFFLSVISLQAQAEPDSLARFFKGKAGAMVIYNSKTNEYIRYNATRCQERFSPASTFKIPNSLIGIETGIITDENFVIKWDGIKREIKEWNQDQTLATAIKYSVVPYYQELARRVGREKFSEYLNKIDYGNKTIGGEVDCFWLDNSLKISAEEQILFLRKFYNYELPFSKRTIDIVKNIMSEEIYSNSKMKFKTGTNIRQGKFIGWLVGYVEKGNNVYFYAFNLQAGSFDDVSKLRNEIPRDILKYLKIIE